MPIRPLGSPRRIALIYLALVLAPSILLVALGWQLFRENRANALQQIQERRRQTAALVVSRLEELSGYETVGWEFHPDGRRVALQINHRRTFNNQVFVLENFLPAVKR